MADLKDLFSKFDSNRIKHRRVYEFTIEKFDKILDDSNELDLENDPIDGSDSDESEEFEDESDQIDKESDNEDINLEIKYVNNYCNEIKRKMTSTPLFPDTMPLKPTILSGITPLIRSIDKKKMPTKSPRNILNTVREHNLLKKINSITTPKLDDKSVILCKPNKENTLHPTRHKLDFNFDLSEEDDEYDAKKSPKKVPNMFEPVSGAVLDSKNNMSNLSPPSPSDKLKDFLSNFARTSKNNHQLAENSLLEKMHQDMELSLPNINNELKEICLKFSQEKSNKNTNQKSPTIKLNKISEKEKNNQLNKSSDKCDESDDDKENDIKLGDLVKNHIKKYPRLNFMQSTPMPSQNTQIERLDFSGLPTATPTDKMKKLSENIIDSREMEINADQNDQVPEMSKNLVNNKNARITADTPKLLLQPKKNKNDLGKSKNSINKPKENDHVPEMTAKFKNLTKPKINQSTPNPLSKYHHPNKNCLEDISNLSVRSNGNQIEISVSDSLNAEMPKTIEKNKKLDESRSGNKLNENGTVLPDHNNDIQIVEIENNSKVDRTKKENLVKKKTSALEERNCEKKSDKRILNLSNVSMDSKRPDLKKICLDHFQEKVLKNCHQHTSNARVNFLQTNKKFRDSNRPDILKACQDKFKQVTIKTERKKINISKETSVLGREFSRDSIQTHNVLALFK
ncbi:hypothetical protein BpHYR1_043173 [Brachionus plicatilis]|uniref:Uncharacterized protein n=1 Tax=Brachionus plicatilis TaxID=10195 RepID=A0A3M7RA81_BRAPC|nr:hypothetical protein BpHYR1_043173 [Brachionus plicatilis]